MAEVYRAIQLGHHGFERTVVVKRLLPQYLQSRSSVKLFVEEAKLGASIQHQNIVQVYELIRPATNEMAIIMEHVDGPDMRWLLTMALRRRRQLPIWLAVHLVTEVLEALAFLSEVPSPYATPRNVVHCDVTPENIFISSRGEVKLGDFGVAVEDARPEDFHLGQMRGKVAYSSPEQVLGERLDGRSDVHSAATVLWEALTGRSLFALRNKEKAKHQVLSGARPPASVYNAQVPDTIDRILQGALDPDRTRRTPTARMFREQLLSVQEELQARISREDVVRAMSEVLAPEPRAPTPPVEDTGPTMLPPPSLPTSPRGSSPDAAPAILPHVDAGFATWVHAPTGVEGPLDMPVALQRLLEQATVHPSAWGLSVTGQDPVLLPDLLRLLDAPPVVPPGLDVDVELAGSLEQNGLPWLFGQLDRTRSHGRLVLSQHEGGRARHRELRVADGHIVETRSEALGLRLWSHLCATGNADAEGYAGALHRALAEARPVVEVLPPGLQAGLRLARLHETRREVEEVFGWTQGDVAFVAQPVSSGVTPGPRLLHLVPHLVLHTYPERRLEASLAPSFSRRVTPTPSFADEIDGFGFLEAERHALEAVLAAPTLAEGLSGLALEARGLAYALIFSLQSVGMLRFAQTTALG